MIDLITSRLISIANHTAILEACSWDESRAERAITDLSDCLHNQLEKSPRFLLKRIREDLFNLGYDSILVTLLVKLVRIEIDSVISILEIEA